MNAVNPIETTRQLAVGTFDDVEQQDLLVKCVTRYAKPDTEKFIEKVRWVAYRIFNAIKSIFGQSDWQKLKKIVSPEQLGNIASTIKNFSQIISLFNQYLGISNELFSKEEQIEGLTKQQKALWEPQEKFLREESPPSTARTPDYFAALTSWTNNLRKEEQGIVGQITPLKEAQSSLVQEAERIQGQLNGFGVKITLEPPALEFIEA